MLLILTVDVFVTREIHTVAETGDDEAIRDGKECEILVVADVLM